MQPSTQEGRHIVLHIDLPTRAQIDQLARYRGSPAVSIFLRTTPLTQDVKADRIELKNLLKEAVGQMHAAGSDKRTVAAVEEHVTALIDDDDFWVTLAHSVAIFTTPDTIQTFRLPNRLTNAVEVSDRFHLSPLIRAVTFPHEAYVLAIGIGATRLIEVTADLPPRPVSAGLPKDFSQALGKRSHVERHGMAGSEESSEAALLTRYARTVDAALRHTLAGHEAPLVIAASEPLASIYRRVSTYPHTASAVIPGSADDTPDHVLAAEARKVLDGIYADEIGAFKALYATRASQGRATSDVAQAARAATYGAVDTLIVDMDASLSGHVSDDDGAVTFDAKPDGVNYSVLDEVARRALHSGARVIAARSADLPAGGQLAAILRYPM
jgi:hypothetical protein